MFCVSITENKKLKLGWEVQLCFQLAVHERDKYILILIKNYFGGLIYRQSSQPIQLKVQSVKDFRVIINHLEKHPLI